MELAEGLHKVGELVVAISTLRPGQVRAVDEYSKKRRYVTEVLNLLGSASNLSKHHVALIFEGFGDAIPKHGPVATCQRQHYHRLCKLRGCQGFLPLYSAVRPRGGVYVRHEWIRGR